MPIWVKEPISGAMVRKEGLGMEESLLQTQVARWMRGLFYHRFRKPLPTDVSIKVEKLQPPEVSLPPMIQEMAIEGLAPKWINDEPDVFSYFYPVTKQDHLNGFAVFVFFNTEVYLSSIGLGIPRFN